MGRIVRFTFAIASFVVVPLGMMCQSATAHTLYKQLMERHYRTIRVTCNACHPPTCETREERTEFGELFFKTMENGVELNARWRELSDDLDAQKDFERQTLGPVFLAALKKIDQMNNEDGANYGELMRAARVEGIRPKRARGEPDDDDDDGGASR